MSGKGKLCPFFGLIFVRDCPPCFAKFFPSYPPFFLVIRGVVGCELWNEGSLSEMVFLRLREREMLPVFVSGFFPECIPFFDRALLFLPSVFLEGSSGRTFWVR